MPQIFVNLLSLQSLKNFKYRILEKLVPKAILQVSSVNIIKKFNTHTSNVQYYIKQ